MSINQELLTKLTVLRKQIYPQVKARMKELSLNSKDYDSLFHELCFCLLAANTSSAMASRICEKVGVKKLLTLELDDLRVELQSHSCRFYNKRSEYIFLARNFDLLVLKHMSVKERREYLLSVKGIGMKEASHYLRNIGHFDYAILDKHVINILKEHKIIRQNKALTPKRYVAIEKKLQAYCDALNISQGELDFYLWYLKTNAVMK